ncbi:MAG TPA: hypothetical protein VLE73_03325 [Candidatus Saccharimonadales bacterium]|nr:hypothetical protein [Candidatus Saccharimonadales bacterium]
MARETLAPTTLDSAVLPGIEVQHATRPLQDVVGQHKAGQYLVFSAYDGHGKEGHIYANHVAMGVRRIVTGEERSVAHAAMNIADYLRRESDNPALAGKDGGTTATVIVAKDNELAAVQLGDSGAAFYPDSDSMIERWLTPIHDVSNPNERARVIRGGGEADDYQGFRQLPGGPWIRTPRAVGDPGFAVVSHVPEIVGFTITEPGTLLVATDGLWGALAAERAEGLASFRETSANPASRMSSERRGRIALYMAQLGRAHTNDDAGVVSVRFEHKTV